MSDLFTNRVRKEPLQLQLTAMIDVFSMIVIFLIFGTVFGAADMVIPSDMLIPKSTSKEGIESAPRVAILKGQVTMSQLDQAVSINDFRTQIGKDQIKAKLAPFLKSYQDKKKATKESSVNPLNLLADQETPYSEIFDVISLFRELGFNTILFVATGEGVPNK